VKRQAYASSCALLAALCSACSAGPDKAPVAAATPDARPSEIDDKTPLPDPLPMVAARVNGRAIPTSQVVIVAEAALRSGVHKNKLYAYRQTLNQLVVRELLLEEAVNRKLAADAAAVEQAYNEARVGYKDDAAWLDALKPQGFTPESFRAELRAKQTVDALLSQEARQAPEPADAEVKQFYDKDPQAFRDDKLKAAHVLLRVSQGAAPERRTEARLRAEEVRGRARAGQDFAALAKKYSEDSTTRDQGGALEPFARGGMMPPFEAAAFALKPGEVSEVVETAYGFHVIKLLERIPGEPLALQQVQEPLRRQLAQQRREEHLQALINRLRARARIELFL
jgi:peptidyl-prolyl cis-trans isomerase C